MKHLPHKSCFRPTSQCFVVGCFFFFFWYLLMELGVFVTVPALHLFLCKCFKVYFSESLGFSENHYRQRASIYMSTILASII